MTLLNNFSIRVLITSKNPVKIRATKDSFSSFYTNASYYTFEVKGCDLTDGNLTSQPIGEHETSEASRMRVKCARILKPDFNYYVGIEGGIVLKSDKIARIIVYTTIGNHDYIETVRGCEIPLPIDWFNALAENKGIELGDIVTKISGIDNIKQKQGAVGFLTNNVLKRVDILKHSVAMALIPFLKENFFHSNTSSF